MAATPGSRSGPALGAVLFAVLVLLSLAAFAITRAARAGDDLVNTVELSPTLTPGESAAAEVRFTLAEPDDSVDVLIIDGNPGSADEQVRALELGADLPAGSQQLSWDGLADDGEPAPPGLYALRVILGQQGRDVLPPGRIEVLGSPGPSGESG